MEQQIIDALKVELDKKGFLNADGVDALILKASQEIEGKIPDITDLKSTIEEQGRKIQEMLEKKPDTKNMTREEVITELYPKLLEAAKTRKAFSFEIPAHKTLLQRSAASGYTPALYLPDVGQAAFRGLVMAGLFNQKTLPGGMNAYVRYLDQTTVTRSADFKAEGTAFAESALAWTEYSAKIEKITDSIPVTWEAMQDLSFVQNEIETLLDRNIAIKEDQALWNADGNTPNIKGIYTYTTAFNAGTSAFVAGIVAPNIADLVAAMSVTISNAKESKFMPNTVILNPVDAMKLRLDKNTFGYVNNPLLSMDGNTIAGMQVAISPSVTANTLLVGDFRYADRYTDGMIRMEYGYVGDQFKEDEMTLKAAKRTLLLVRTVDVGAFLKCESISADLATLTASGS